MAMPMTIRLGTHVSLIHVNGSSDIIIYTYYNYFNLNWGGKMLQQLHLNKRKKQVLKGKVHLDYLNK